MASEARQVDVVTPAYNAARTVAETVESVLRQTHRNWRLWIVDDGSHDETADIVRPYLRDPRIQLVQQNNRGAANARNLALAQGRGDYVAFLDSDDYWETDFLARTVAALEHEPEAGLVWCEMRVVGERSGTYRDEREAIAGDPPATLEAIYRAVTFLPSCTLFRASYFREGLRWRQDCSPVEDMPIFLSVASRSRVIRLADVLANYRVHQGSSTTAHGALGRNYRSMIFAFRLLYRQYRPHISTDAYRQRMWWLHHFAGDNLLAAGTPRPWLFVLALYYCPMARVTWKSLGRWILGRGPNRRTIDRPRRNLSEQRAPR